MKYSHTLLKRFIKDYNLQFATIQQPYFDYFCNLFKDYYKLDDKFKILNESLKQFNSEEEFINETYKIRDKIINTLKSYDFYEEYNNFDLKKYDIPNTNTPSKDIFKMTNINKYFMSIDLKKANFQALKFFVNKYNYKNNDVYKSNSYEEFIDKFTNLEYMKQSKYLRQVIFGNINPKRQVKLEKYITYQILQYILEFINPLNIKMFANDEIVIELEKSQLNDFNNLSFIINNKFNINVDVEIFQLKSIKNKKFFVKEFLNKEGYELKCIPLVYFAQIFKQYHNLTINDNDLVFFYENQVCKFLQPLNFDE